MAKINFEPLLFHAIPARSWCWRERSYIVLSGEILRWHIVRFAYKSGRKNPSLLLSEQFWDGIWCRNFAYKKVISNPFPSPYPDKGICQGEKIPHHYCQSNSVMPYNAVTLHTKTLHVLYQAMIILNPFPSPYPDKGMCQGEKSLIIIVTAILRCQGQLNAGDVVEAYEITACHVSDGDDGAGDEWRNCGIAAGGVLRGIMCGVS